MQLRINSGVRVSCIGILLAACGSDPAGPAVESSTNVAAATAVTGVDLGGIGGDNNLASAIAASGLIGGRVQAPEGSPSYSVLFEGATPTILPHHPLAINGLVALSDLDAGGTVAVSNNLAWTRPAGGEWSPATELPHLGGGQNAFSVNSSGVIAGYLQPAIGPGILIGEWFGTPTGATAALWTPPATPGGPYSTILVAGLPGCSSHSLREINAAGTAVGWSVCPSGKKSPSRPFVRTAAGATVALSMGSYTSIQATGISQAGHVSGMAAVTNRTMAVLLWTPQSDGTYGAPQQVLVVDSNNGAVLGVNSCGSVLGRRTANNDIQGFLVSPDGAVTDLYPIPGGKQPVPQEINDNGIVVGWTYVVSGKGRTEVVQRKATKWLVGSC